jgi:hypothetical protein
MGVGRCKVAYAVVVWLFIIPALSQISQAHPGWVQTGAVAYYQATSAFKDASGNYNSGVQMDITENVDSASNGNIVVTSTFREPTSGYTITNTSSYGPSDALGAFWYDDKVLQNMKTGDTVNVFIKGVGSIPFNVTKGPYKDLFGKIWDRAVMLEIKDKTEFRLIYDERTGLLLHQAEVYPNQETYIDLKSISVDLSNYVTPETGGTLPSNGNGGNLPGNGGSNQNNSGGNPLSSNVCGSVFLILGCGAMAFARVVRR